MADLDSLTLNYDFTDPQFDGTTGIEAQTGPTLTVTRPDNATVMDYFNVLKTVNDNEPRFTGGRRVENLCLYSQAVDNAWWVDGGLDRTADTGATTDPIGGNTADIMTCDGAATSCIWRSADLGSGLQNKTVTASIYVKYIDRQYLQLQFGASWTLDHFACVVDLSGETITATGDQGDGTYISSSIESLTNGWMRVSVTGTNSNAINEVFCRMTDSSSYQASIAVTASTKALYVWGAQVEDVTGQDDPAPSEYIATTDAAKAQWYATKRRTNLSTYGNQFDIAGTDWTHSAANRLQIGATGVSSPLGATGSELQIGSDDAGTNARGIVKLPQPGVLNQTDYTLSAYVKASTREWLWMDLYDATIGLTGVYFQLTGAGTVGTEGSGVTGTIELVSDGWYRCSVTGQYSDASTARTYISPADADLDYNLAGTQGDSIMYLDGVQLERGSTATAYIATTDAIASSDFDTAITPTGLLIEEARTNVFKWTESFDNAAWGKTALTCAGADINAATAPDGTLTADRLNVDVSTSVHRTWQHFTAYNATDVVFSCFFKADGNTYPHLDVYGGFSTNYICATYDLTAGTVSQTAVGSTSGTIAGTGIDDVGNGWFRCWIAGKITDVDQYPTIYFADSATPTVGSSGQVTYLGVAGEDLLVWGADFQAGSFPTSYIPNDSATASVTRAFDVVSTTDYSWLADDAGSFYADFAPAYVTLLSGNQVIMYQDPSYFCYFSGDNLQNYDGTGGTVFMLDGTYSVATDSPTKYVLGYDGSDLERVGWFNGEAALYGNPYAYKANGLGNTSTIYIGSKAGTDRYYTGHIARIVYYDERLADSVLEDLSNGTFPVAASSSAAAGLGLTFGKIGMR